ncbi:NACHT C-terminal helical domain 2-containing protein [Anabaena subtropica]|uniref:NACHT conflict system C-terminal helical domain-containing protein n=1 Tax=Anabaena subtropica FACHB-260 TaxID=2692884 RepID=A0ABR8CYF3_9NOST|nr:hypothetical protein [Anabaena subtropica]MBD2346830.1 hypothetical protein [Anabaena subtropica FACHB-260]
MAVSILKNADDLLKLMKIKIDNLIADNRDTQFFLDWVEKKASRIKSNLKPSSMRAAYHYLVHVYRDNKAEQIYAYLESRDFMDSPGNYYLPRKIESQLINVKELLSSSSLLLYSLDPNLYKSLNKYSSDYYKFKQNSQFWEIAESLFGKFSTSSLDYYSFDNRDSPQHKYGKTIFTKYYNLNNLLIYCLKNSNNVSQEVMKEIDETLLLPIAEIEKRKREIAE